MSYRDLLVDNYLYIVRWDVATVPDVLAACDKISLAAAAGGGPVVTVWIGSADTPIPQGELRSVMTAKLRELMALGEVHNVIEGRHFKGRILRSLVTNLFLVAGYRSRMFVYQSLDEVLIVLTAKLRARHINVEEVRAEAVRRGILPGPELAPAASMSM